MIHQTQMFENSPLRLSRMYISKQYLLMGNCYLMSGSCVHLYVVRCLQDTLDAVERGFSEVVTLGFKTNNKPTMYYDVTTFTILVHTR